MEKEVFYYHFRKLNFWLFFNFLLTALVVCCLARWPICIYWWKLQFLIGVIAVSFVLWFLMYVKKHRLAVFDNDGVALDHCVPLSWTDIVSARETKARCLFRKRPILVLQPKEGLEYPYNAMQKLSMKSDFTAFSFPLYAMSAQDKARLYEILKERGIPVLKSEQATV